MTYRDASPAEKASIALIGQLAILNIFVETVHPSLLSLCIERIVERSERPNGGHEQSYIDQNARWYAGIIFQVLDDRFTNEEAAREWNDLSKEMIVRTPGHEAIS